MPKLVSNQNGFVYRNGAAHPIEIRLNIIRLYLASESGVTPTTLADISEQAGPSEAFCKQIIEKFEQGESIEPRNRKNNSNSPLKMGVMEIEVLQAIVESKPTGLIREYRDLLRETIHLEVSDSTVCHYVNNILLMTLKETTVIRVERYYPENVQKYHEFLVIVFNKPAHKLHFFDEMMGTPRARAKCQSPVLRRVQDLPISVQIHHTTVCL